MFNEIPKFRAWLIIENFMIENVGLLPDGRVILVPNEEFDSEQYAPHFFNLSDLIGIYEKSEVILMQSTGLSDKNGVEIFDGDIVRFKFDFESCGEMNHHDGYHMVHTSERGIGLQFKKLAWVDGGKNQVWNVESRGLFFQDKILGYWANDMKSSVQCEMVGNIHANADLLND